MEKEKQGNGWSITSKVGYKEASHFLRNVGYHQVAILDRHILRVLNENGLIGEIPKSLTPKKYKEIERIVLELTKETEVFPSEMDLYLWYSNLTSPLSQV